MDMADAADEDRAGTALGWRFEEVGSGAAAAMDATSTRPSADRVGVDAAELKRTYRVRKADGAPVKQALADSARVDALTEGHAAFRTAKEAPGTSHEPGRKVFLQARGRFVAAQG
ncbi:hypothetical protein FV218_10365 [Methylobacterium sp. WL69]|uniref:hypothetical protein n=1 Tax=Methylobacterium sp. WL69 TaxID=2603893 RepID=UPI0011D8D9B9|nr:hypothetical protein [Methylobacterium sp. WL69]TXM74201.1 hypothetical protein FV218_10365 [Methylobacterium sp. WL69]